MQGTCKYLMSSSIKMLVEYGAEFLPKAGMFGT